MNTCAGDRHDPHPEICHEQSSSDCPLCEERKGRRENENLVGELRARLDRMEEIQIELDALKQKTSHMAWALEDVPTVKSDEPEHSAGGQG